MLFEGFGFIFVGVGVDILDWNDFVWSIEVLLIILLEEVCLIQEIKPRTYVLMVFSHCVQDDIMEEKDFIKVYMSLGKKCLYIFPFPVAFLSYVIPVANLIVINRYGNLRK